MHALRFWWLLFFAVYMAHSVWAQKPMLEENRSGSIAGIKFFRKGNQQNFPVIRLGETDGLELRFDDLNTSSKAYFYTYVLCNADWTPANLSQMDYLRGFSQLRIMQFRFSGGTMSRYVHYEASLPAKNAIPNRAGNYLLKVFENGDTSKLLFSRRFLIVNDRASVAVRMEQPFAQENFLTHQKIIVDVNFRQLDVLNPSREVKLVVMQNNRWDNARLVTNPTFIRGRNFEYSDEINLVFEGGKEWRWLDLRSFRLQSDRVAKVDYNQQPYDVYIRPDTTRSPLRYFLFPDINGAYFQANLENINPWWQSDIGRVHFTFLPQHPEQFSQLDLYIFGEMTGFQFNDKTRMRWNESNKAYEVDLLLKNGFYNYSYVTLPKGSLMGAGSFRFTEGNAWQAENNYRILVYFTPFGSRFDELVSVVEVSSQQFMNLMRR
jgi:hypothetical protein